MDFTAFPSPRRLATAIATTAALAAFVPAGALATDYCVDNAACVTAGGVSQPSLEEALALAGSNFDPDHVTLGAGTYTAPTTAGFVGGPFPVQITGAGAGATTLTGPLNGGTVLSMSNAASSVSDLAITIPLNSDGASKLGLRML